MTICLASCPSVLFSQAKTQIGIASFYSDFFEGRTTASGEIFAQSELTAAHRSLPFGTVVEVTNLKNNKSVIVIVNDRGPFVQGRIIDLSKTAAKILGFIKSGLTKVKVKIIEKEKIPKIGTDLKNRRDSLTFRNFQGY